MIIESANPYSALKCALMFALGRNWEKRPEFDSLTEDNHIVLKGDSEEDYEFSFDPLNTKYVEELPIGDLAACTDEEFGKYFYEYGRSILANLMIAITKADTHVNNEQGLFSTEYYYNFLKLKDKACAMIEAFEKGYLNNMKTNDAIKFDSMYVAEKLAAVKDSYMINGTEKDLPNYEIFYCAYVGLLFTLYGLELLLADKSNIQVSDFIGNPKSSTIKSFFRGVFKPLDEDDGERDRLASLMYAFFTMTAFYGRTSGLDFKNFPTIINNQFELCASLLETIRKDGKSILDGDFTDESFINGISITTFTIVINPFDNPTRFERSTIIHSDNTNFFKFGDEFIKGINWYEFDSDGNRVTGVPNIIKTEYVHPPMQSYIDCAIRTTDVDPERAFKLVEGFLSDVDNDKYNCVDPGSFMYLTVLGAAFRKIESSKTFNGSNKSKLMIESAIDIIDTYLYYTYNNWFNTGKLFKQMKRPNYNGEGAMQTLNLLKSEIDDILFRYFEYVRFGVSADVAKEDSALYALCKGCSEGQKITKDEILRVFPMPSPSEFVKLCAKRNGYSFAETIYFDGTECSFENLIGWAAKPLDEAVFDKLSRKSADEFTKSEILNRIIECIPYFEQEIERNPEEYMLVIYGSLWSEIDKIFKALNVGNYFDFGKADDAISKSSIDDILVKCIVVPLQKAIQFKEL